MTLLADTLASMQFGVNNSVFTKNPQFATLLDSLKEKLTPDTSSRDLRDQVDQNLDKTRIAANSYVKNKVVFDLLQNASQNSDFGFEVSILKEEMKEAIIGLEEQDVAELLPPDNDRVTLTQNAIQQQISKAHKELSKNFKNYNSSIKEATREIPEKEREYQDNNKLIHSERLKQLHKMFIIIEATKSSLVDVTSAIDYKYYHVRDQAYHIQTKYLLAKVTALQHKFRLAIADLEKTSYKEETLPALQQINVLMDDKKKELESETKSTTAAINRYKSLGKEFEDVVNEYAQIQGSINVLKWGTSNENI